MRIPLLAALTAALSTPLIAQDAPAVAPHPALAALQQALAKARADNQRVVAVATADDGASAAAFDALVKKNPKLSRYLLYEYQRVVVPAAAIDANDRFAELKPAGEGAELLVLDPAGSVRARAALAALLEGKDPGAAITAWLTPFQAPPVDARELLADALAKATTTKRRVLVHLGAPW